MEIERRGNSFFWRRRKLGEIVGNRFVTHRDKEHFYVKGRGFCLNEELVRELVKEGVDTIVLIYHGERGEKAFKISPDRAFSIGSPVKEPGFERQICISEDEFDEVLDGS